MSSIGHMMNSREGRVKQKYAFHVSHTASSSQQASLSILAARGRLGVSPKENGQSAACGGLGRLHEHGSLTGT
jgi:hypothetical protein